MEHEIEVADAAMAELVGIVAWIARDSSTDAVRWLGAFWKSVRSLRSYPGRCPLAPEDVTSIVEVRQLVFGDYRVLFTIRDSQVRVLHVRHGAMRPLGDKGWRRST